VCQKEPRIFAGTSVFFVSSSLGAEQSFQKGVEKLVFTGEYPR
jgi:hypothetical protein